jgi:SAM-dependent methyltransferase
MPSAIFFEGTASPPILGGDYSRLDFQFVHTFTDRGYSGSIPRMNALSTIETAVFKRVTELGQSNGRVNILDAPCGAGVLALMLKKAGMKVRALDIESTAASLLGSSFLTADLNQTLPIADKTFDLVVSVEGLEHLENPHLFLREVNRVLKNDGWLILTTPNIISLRSRVRFLGSGFFHRDSMPLNETARHGLHHIGLRSFPQLRYDLHTLGFQLHEVAATHIKPVSYLYGIFIPWMFLYTMIAFRKEKDRIQRKRNREILRTLFSSALLFGENLLLVARKVV